MDVLAGQIAVPFLIGVSKQDLPEVWTPEEVAAYFRVPASLVRPVVCIDAASSRALLADLFELVAGAETAALA